MKMCQTMMKTISRSQFLSHLKSRALEDISVIHTIEKSLQKKRGHIFRRPKTGAPVILLLSGGIDSITSWGVLLQEYGYHVYPISFDRGEKRVSKEKASIEHYATLYQKRFPRLFHAPMRVQLGVERLTIPIQQFTHDVHPEILLDAYARKNPEGSLNVSMGSYLLLPVYAKLYAEYLLYTQNIRVRSIFCGVIVEDGLIIPHQTFTALRSVMYYLCTATGDFDWQFSSVFFEKETGMYWAKSDVVQWAHSHRIPLAYAWSCYHSGRYQCGGTDCITCRARRNAFETAGVLDETRYKPLARQTLIGEIRHKARRLAEVLQALRR